MDYEELRWSADDAIRELEDLFDFHSGEAPKAVQPRIAHIQIVIQLLKQEIIDLDLAIEEITSQE